MLIEKKNTADLLPADYNPRKDLKPGDKEYKKLKRSIEQFGYVEPVIWNKTTARVVGGHQRLKVLIDMGMTEGLFSVSTGARICITSVDNTNIATSITLGIVIHLIIAKSTAIMRVKWI